MTEYHSAEKPVIEDLQALGYDSYSFMSPLPS